MEFNECSNFVWPDLYFERLGNGKESVHGRGRLYSSTVNEAPDLVDLVADAPVVGAQALERDEDSPPAKRSRQHVSRHRSVVSSSSSSSQVEPDDGLCRSVLSRPRPRPRSGRSGSRFSSTALDLADSSSASVGALCGFTEAFETSSLAPFGATVS